MIDIFAYLFSRLNAHRRYLVYVLRHKWFVLGWCIRYGIPWAGITHDLSKFSPAEWGPYVDKFYGGPWPEENPPGIKYEIGDLYTQTWVDTRFDEAWNHHQKHNPHHWQYWILREDGGTLKVLDIPHRYRLEMLADWRGAGMAITGRDDTRGWYERNREKMILHPNTRRWVEWMLGYIWDDNGQPVNLLDPIGEPHENHH